MCKLPHDSLATNKRHVVCLFLHDKQAAGKAPLCNGCIEYVTADKSRNEDVGIVWQCFAYKILIDYSKQMQLWMTMPGQLQKW
jgi:hypothetical protein